jgi:hypothetical protein
MIPPEIARKSYERQRGLYRTVQWLAGRGDRATIDATIILISGCQDNQTSLDGDHNGAFTEQLLKVWNHGGYRGNYAKFHAAIKAGLPASQTPNLFTLGAATRFAQQQPFTV